MSAWEAKHIHGLVWFAFEPGLDVDFVTLEGGGFWGAGKCDRMATTKSISFAPSQHVAATLLSSPKIRLFFLLLLLYFFRGNFSFFWPLLAPQIGKN